MVVEQIHLFARSLDLCLVSRHCADYPVHFVKFALSSKYVLSVLCKDNFDGLCYVCHIRGKQVNKCFGKYFVFGFSYKQDAPLDMRMDESAALTAREVVNTYSYEELRRILFEYGEERYAPAIAKRICQHREQKPIETTLELADIIRSAMPASALREKQHPAKRSFQAIRIAVNTFHSLEDRIVKKKLQELAQGCICPPEFPVCVCGRKPKVKLITRKPIVSGEEELAENPRARSAKLRVAEKC